MPIMASPELEKISRRLAAQQGMDEDTRSELVRSYLDFLEEAAAASDDVAPPLAVDEIWHRHILDTQAYDRDCRRWFGTFIHHRPDSALEDIAGHDAVARCSAPEPEPPCRAIAAQVRAVARCSAPEPVPVPPCRAAAAQVR